MESPLTCDSKAFGKELAMRRAGPFYGRMGHNLSDDEKDDF